MTPAEPIEVVISGIGGGFPQANNWEQLKKNLFDKTDVITVNNTKWNPDLYNYPKGTGKISSSDYFDSSFFRIPDKVSSFMDPMNRLVMEKSIEALIDSGNNPAEFKRGNIAVYAGVVISETDLVTTRSKHNSLGYAITGLNNAMIANCISYFLDLCGPSCCLHGSWTVGVDVLKLAAKQIEQGHIDGALISVSALHAFPNITAEMISLGTKDSPVLSSDGKCRSFDSQASGYPRSEAVVCFFLQKKSDAKRNYGTIVQADTSCFGFRDCSLIELEQKLISDYLLEFYKKCDIDPSTVAYVEADGCAIKRFEGAELNSIAEVFCCERISPLLIGSVKSNLGHTEGASALVSITKTLIAMDAGVIPPNMHYKSPNHQVPALVNGQMKVVTKPEPLPGDLTAVNTLGFTGSFSHVLLRQNPKAKKNMGLPEDGLPRLILTSARHEEGISRVNKLITSMPLDAEYAALINNIHKHNIQGYMYRSYTMLPYENNAFTEEVKEYDRTTPKVWYIFSGMGSQWNGMGSDLLRLPVFAAAITKCQKILEPLGIDLIQVLTSKDPKVFNNILNSFVGIAAVQIGLVDILNSLGIVPDGIVGHSVGELGCAYADGCFTAEEMILAAYARGKASVDTPLIRGMMAAVGLSYNTIKDRLPESIEVACHNSDTNCTISGPADDVNKFVQELKEQKIFAASVNVANIAFHSRYISSAAPVLLRSLKEVIKEPKRRSSKWLSSSIPEEDWNSPLAQFSSPEYHTNNLLSSVLFEETCKHIPDGAVCIEIAPHGLLQSILRRSLNAVQIPLTSRSANCNLRHLLVAIGKMYLNNLLLDVNAIYPKVEYPVSRLTPGLAPFATWLHDVPFPQIYTQYQTGQCHGKIEMKSILDSNDFLLGHRIYNKLVTPVSQFLIVVWREFSRINQSAQLLSVAFEDIYVYERNVTTAFDQSVLIWSIQTGTGSFEISVTEDNDIQKPIMVGKISLLDTTSEKRTPCISSEPGKDGFKITQEEFYNFIESKGYQLDFNFRSVKELYLTETKVTADITWNKNWLLFLDSLCKLSEFFAMKTKKDLLVTNIIRTLKINLKEFPSENIGNVSVFKNTVTNTLQCQGVQMDGMEFAKYTTLETQSNLKVEKFKFLPVLQFYSQMEQFLSRILLLMKESHLMLWKNKDSRLIIYEIKSDKSAFIYSDEFKTFVNMQANIEIQKIEVPLEELQSLIAQNSTTSHLIITNSNQLNNCAAMFNDNGPVFFLCVSSGKFLSPDNSVIPILQHKSSNKQFTLCKKSVKVNNINVIENLEGPDWKTNLSQQVGKLDNNGRIVVIWKGISALGVIRTCQSLAKEEYVHRLSCFFILDKNAPEFSKGNPFYSGQISLCLTVNVFSDGMWGGFQNLSIADILQHEEQIFEFSLPKVDHHYIGINSKCITMDEGLEPDIEIGQIEYSGLTQNDEQVMGLALFDQHMKKITPDSILTWNVPPAWSLEDAATVPFAYAVAYCALSLYARLKKGECVLVNGGESYIGEAAIAVAFELGGNVYATVSNDKQALALAKRFPQLKEKQILTSKKNFDLEILMATKGVGIQVVVNNASESVLQKSMNCLAVSGRFIQLNKNDMVKREKIGMRTFLKNVSFYGMASNNVFNATQEWKLKMQTMLQDGINKGVVKPMARKVFKKDQSNLIMSYLKETSGQEKVVLATKEQSMSKTIKSEVGFKCSPDQSYLIVANKHDLWMDLTEWLVDQGARKFLIALDTQPINGLNVHRMNNLITQYGTTIVKTSAERLELLQTASELIKEVSKLGPLAAIFTIFLDETSSQAVKNLDTVSRELTPKMSHFVCLFGGDSAVCEERRRSGLPSLSVQYNSPLSKPKAVLKYLQQLLDDKDTSCGPQLILVADSVNTSNFTDTENSWDRLHEYLPTKEELYGLGAIHRERPYIEETCTLSPRFKDLLKSANVRMVFIFPGFCQSRLEPLVRKLIYPSYSVQLPTVYKTIEETAAEVIEEIFKVNKSGPYTFVSETWSGTLAIEVARQMETQGHIVTLFLLEAVPSVTQSWARMFGQPDTPEFEDNLLSVLLNMNMQTKPEFKNATNWDERLQCALKLDDGFNKSNYKNALTAFRNMLVALLQYKPSENLFQGNVHLLHHNGFFNTESADLSLYCKKLAKVYEVSDTYTHSKLISNDLTAQIINEFTNLSWC